VTTATNKDLREEVRAGRFREDLLYRLNVITLRVPTLNERKEDIPILANYFLARKAKSKSPKKLSPGALSLLMSYDWPGNVRELEHVLEGAVLLSTGDHIEESDLSMYFHRPDRSSAVMPSAAANSIPESVVCLEDIERHHIEKTLKQFNYSRSKTAEALGISKKTLYLKIKRYGMKVAD
jgi:DNA-binding NtrC family response regulator